ncbi:MAG: ATP-binding protein, partial [Longimicrobiales bacterium]
VKVGGPGGSAPSLLVAGEYLLLAVHDTGRGMDEETVARIFEPFFTTRTEGSGLGLASVYAIVHENGGGVSVESRPDVGTTFRVYLPRAADADVQDSDDIVAGSETILLVEDDDAVRSLLCTMLGRLGYRVHAFAGARAALDAADTPGVVPDLLLSDVIMPELKGPELAQRLRQRFPYMRTLYISGYSDAALQRYGIREDGALLVQKPFTARALARTVRQALGLSGS